MSGTNRKGLGMFSEVHAGVYDTLYRARGKDRSDESKLVTEWIRKIKPDTRSVLDVGCGTGAHLGPLNETFEHVEGLDLAEPMLAIARKQLDPTIQLHHGDMCDFTLQRSFDALICMFCSIAYAGDLARIRTAIANMAEHLNPGGVLIVEPWWFTDKFLDGYVNGDTWRDDDGRVISRTSHSVREGDHTKMTVLFVIADADGIRHYWEPEQLTLCTREDYLAAFVDAGLDVEYHEGAPGGRGLFVAVKK
ncbi:dTDP-3-amino-3,4,6-trideoxy-alpha-D-glucopyranose N,N-dimethyltransferase/N-dimethyltransferase [Tamaricihabitans halophyticus]|uniref:dTDP-3-amino-3,4, 6-trideoxy-alpha-D-glucopyranose N,N-dimethyltransferase/N-dimethyltransferase n=1 Tax=Tamaricihabitans halophyticus TaxID=1262583 RepID=A0A4R2QU16_9PSEU|nr:class I SAM-dependent methyltransferase [Tamaricihabitans halophyticus]TCP53443.1 dTDP-3-amino-3,4,6-trideoxy-alpha-D-glucopyranose N,N-dimethyltransferase/N-dimethyltransferase [Tamaricihabitans halophyticus]